MIGAQWKKVGLLATCSLVFMTGVQAEESQKQSWKQRRKKEKAVEAEPSIKKKEEIVITPAANPCVKSGQNMWFQLEGLYMRPSEDNMLAGYITNTATAPILGKGFNAKYDWSFGARGAIGYNTPHDGWDILGRWTWFQASKGHSYTADKVHTEVNTFGVYAAPSNISRSLISLQSLSVSAKTHLRINIGDIELGRECLLSPWLKFRPHVGGRALLISQALYTRSGPLLADAGIFDTGDRVKQFLKIHCKAGGIYAGFNADWGFAKNWSLYALFDQSLVYGRSSSFFSESKIPEDSVESTVIQIEDATNVVRGITDLSLGFRWSSLLHQDRIKLLIQLAWEEHLFYNFNTFDPEGITGNLALSGISLQMRLDF